MSNAIEIEAKALLDQEGYKKLRRIYQLYPSYCQTNYYIDTEDGLLRKEGFGLRIREKGGNYEMTLKAPLSQGFLEKNCTWDAGMFHDFEEGGPFPDGDIKRFLTMCDIPVDALRIRTSLRTTRVDIPYQGGKLSIDENHYSGIVDYEIELEYSNEKDAEQLLHELLETTGVTYTPGTKTKVTRALNAYEASKK